MVQRTDRARLSLIAGSRAVFECRRPAPGKVSADAPSLGDPLRVPKAHRFLEWCATHPECRGLLSRIGPRRPVRVDLSQLLGRDLGSQLLDIFLRGRLPRPCRSRSPRGTGRATLAGRRYCSRGSAADHSAQRVDRTKRTVSERSPQNDPQGVSPIAGPVGVSTSARSNDHST